MATSGMDADSTECVVCGMSMSAGSATDGEKAVSVAADLLNGSVNI